MSDPGLSESLQTITQGKPSQGVEKYRHFLLIFTLVGVLLGILIPVAATSGIFDRWQALPPAPDKPVKLLGTGSFWGGFGNLYIQAENDRIYMYNGSRWTPSPADVEIYSEGCSTAGLKFSRLKRPFSGSYQCAQVYGHGDVAPAPLYTYVLDRNGTLWTWTESNLLICFLPITITGGVILGLTAYFVWLAVMHVKTRRAHDSTRETAPGLTDMGLKSLRRVARGWSVFSILLLLGNDLLTADFGYRGYFMITAAVAVPALAAAWRWPKVGGGLTLAVFFARIFYHLTRPYGLAFSLIFEAVCFAPGFLFTLYGYFSGRLKENRA